MKIINEIINNKYVLFIYRNIIWLVLVILSMWFFKATMKEIDTLLLLVAFEGLALGLSGIAVYTFTSINFLKELSAGEDKKYSVYERQALTNTLGRIFIGVHLLIGLGVFSIYLARFAGA